MSSVYDEMSMIFTGDQFFIRNLDAENYFENFLVAAVSAILIIRLYLHLMHYPTIGGAGLHIAHMLWGGLLMMIGFILLVGLLSRSAVRIAVIISGVGFGVFIDEIGKFLTRDNNYFFQPSIAIIYVIFVLFYLLTKALPKYKTISQKEYLINALDMTKEAVLHDMDIEEKRQALAYLKKCDKKDPLVMALYTLIHTIEVVPIRNPGILTTIRSKAREIYYYLLEHTWFHQLILTLIWLQAVTGLFLTFILLAEVNRFFFFLGALFILISTLFVTRKSRFYLRFLFIILSILLLFTSFWLSVNKIEIVRLSFIEIGAIVSSLVSTLFVILGINALRDSKLEAYHLFKQSILISIFLTQFFLFYQLQFYALIGLVINLLILLTLQYMITETASKTLELENSK